MKPLTHYIRESILSSTGAGANSFVLFNIIKYLKDIKNGGSQKYGGISPEVIDLLKQDKAIVTSIPGTTRESRLNEVFKFWFPR